ncbi:protein NRT1/ PTR FAMILY 5.5-like [Salvia miltiorrhiza]|uniref:protein NRT1/ PTR FAMILY 5.5-like n=1 Tax=Salvia miltiorrhiza TaxID=226208 RepID=UPI0025AB8260|nr:protein NRT1/ PTR FAMILY 5.5-like [Salvia miltiorrhiza]
MAGKVRSSALAWADIVVEGTLFLMQNYLTDIWKLSFFKAAAFLNIWGGIYRILPILIVFLAGNGRNSLLNFIMLAASGIFSTTGLVLITYSALPAYRCHHQDREAQCVGPSEKIEFITGMALIGLGKATRFAFSQPIMNIDEVETTNHEDEDEIQAPGTIGDRPAPSLHEEYLNGPSCELPRRILMYFRWILVVFFFVTPAVAFFTFPYVKKWYLLFGISAMCTLLATLSHLSGFRTYKESVSTPATVVKQAAIKLLSQELAIKLGFSSNPNTSSSQTTNADHEQPPLKFDHTVFRMAMLYTGWIICGIVSSIGNTYFVQQATLMDYNIGHWKPPLQVLQLIFLVFKLFYVVSLLPHEIFTIGEPKEVETSINSALMYSVLCCAAAAAVERRRIHAARRRNLVDDAKTPMSAFWLFFQLCFLGIVEGSAKIGISLFQKQEAPELIKRYRELVGEAVTGFGYMCSVLSVYVVGKISETGGGKGWFQHTLNGSRLDRYYWVLTGLTGVKFLVLFVTFLYW